MDDTILTINEPNVFCIIVIRRIIFCEIQRASAACCGCIVSSARNFSRKSWTAFYSFHSGSIALHGFYNADSGPRLIPTTLISPVASIASHSPIPSNWGTFSFMIIRKFYDLKHLFADRLSKYFKICAVIFAIAHQICKIYESQMF